MWNILVTHECENTAGLKISYYAATSQCLNAPHARIPMNIRFRAKQSESRRAQRETHHGTIQVRHNHQVDGRPRHSLPTRHAPLRLFLHSRLTNQNPISRTHGTETPRQSRNAHPPAEPHAPGNAKTWTENNTGPNWIGLSAQCRASCRDARKVMRRRGERAREASSHGVHVHAYRTFLAAREKSVMSPSALLSESGENILLPLAETCLSV